MKGSRIALATALISATLSAAPANAQQNAPPNVMPELREAVANIPIAGIKDALNDLHAALKKGEHGGYSAKTTATIPGVGQVPLQLYFYGEGAKQALLLVVDRDIGLPPVFNNKAWKQLDGTTLSDPMFSFSTVDFALDVREMPVDFKKVVADSYFNVTSLNFTSGFQVTAKAKLDGAMKTAISTALNFKVSEFTLRAGVVLPVPTDASGSASLAAQLAADMKNVGKTVKDLPDFFVEFQPKPGTVIHGPIGMSKLTLTDATISLTAHLVLGFRGNMVMTNGKKFITFFQTPLTPLGVMDLGDFQFGMTAQTMTLEDAALWTISMNSPQAPGGSFVRGVDKYTDKLLLFTKPLAVFQIRNPNRIGEYRFGDATKPFPKKSDFSMLVLGPLAASTDSTGQTLSGPYFQAIGDMSVLGQKMASMRLTVGDTGLHGMIDAGLTLKMGPLGKTGIRMRANADVTRDKQLMVMQGNAFGRALNVSMDTTNLTVDSPATCATPFELKQRVSLESSLNLSSLMDNLPGVNVDPARLQNCIGKDLEAAYKWVSTTGSALGGYTAAAANAELKKISNQAAEAARKAEEAERRAEQEAKAAYNRAKDEARNQANQASNSAMNAFNDAGNAFKKLGKKKKKHKKGPDPKFAASVFDWDFYYDKYPDVVRAKVDLATHWQSNGFREGRQGSPEFSARDYLNRYPDLQNYCHGDFNCALSHWLDHGIAEGRQGSPDISIRDYLARYPDLQNAFGRDNYAEAMDHWLNNGEEEGRNGRPR
jgi:hypothetical protein